MRICISVGFQPLAGSTSQGQADDTHIMSLSARMSVEHSEIGTEVEVGKLDGKQKRLPAKIVPFPFYDPTKSRVRDVPPPE